MKATSALLPIAGVLTAGLMAAPAFASTSAKPAVKPTSITLKATHATTAPKHKVSLTATLKAGRKRLEGETLYLEKRDAATHKFGDPVAISAPTDANGQTSVPVTLGNKKGHKDQKEQYRVVFQGDSADKASRSGVITITVS